MALYPVILERDDRPDEIRLHDRPMQLGQNFPLLGRLWEVHIVDDDSKAMLVTGELVSARYFCRPSL